MNGRLRRDPYGEISSLREQMNRLWDSIRPVLGWRSNWSESSCYPRVDIYQTEDEVILVAEVPGLRPKEDLEIAVSEDSITLRGEVQRDAACTQEGVYHHERYYGRFHRTFNLPAEVKPEEVRATYRDGVLEVHLPKSEASRKKWVKVEVH
ncbi:Hsp20/alpha crystallin family protein [Desulfothermobacter acidiphilus]|uniref:Hsp20/alpha crystallin family protein n=1 Tax=Desulfothermobacter acidiphilus TaxID=1938353 RepID=UPI003F8A450C